MALVNAYAEVADINLSTERGLNDQDDQTLIERMLNAASRQIDKHCGRPHGFWQDASVVTRVYSTSDAWCCYVPDDISTVTGLIIKIDSNLDGTYATTLSASEYTLSAGENFNALADGWGCDTIHLTSSASATFPVSSRPNVQVTAKFGWPDIPADVQEACVDQARRLLKSSPFGVVEFADAGGGLRLGASLHPDAKAMLAGYVRGYV